MAAKQEITYTQKEVEYRDDLQQKLLTLEHVKSILIGRDDSPVFIHQINDLSELVRSWLMQSIEAKRGLANEQKETKEEGSDTGTPDDQET